MENRFLVIGLIGGILATVGVFLPWISERFPVYISISGWDGLSRSVSESKDVLLVLIGGVLAVIGGLAALAVKVKRVDYLIPLGGILAIFGCIWFTDRIPGWDLVSYGIMCLVLGVTGGLASTVLAVKAKRVDYLIPIGGILAIFCILLGGILVIFDLFRDLWWVRFNLVSGLALLVLVIGGLALTVLAVKAKRVYLIPVGGILPIFWYIGSGGWWFWASYGFLMCLVGAMLALVGGSESARWLIHRKKGTIMDF